MFASEAMIPDDNVHLRALQDELGCTIPRTPGLFWGDFLQQVTPVLVSNYDYVYVFGETCSVVLDMQIPTLTNPD